jgi:hypothetical protein
MKSDVNIEGSKCGDSRLEINANKLELCLLLLFEMISIACDDYCDEVVVAFYDEKVVVMMKKLTMIMMKKLKKD